jgi:hypothetical protein
LRLGGLVTQRLNRGSTGNWAEVVARLTNRSHADFVKMLDRYRAGREKGTALHSITIAR